MRFRLFPGYLPVCLPVLAALLLACQAETPAPQTASLESWPTLRDRFVHEYYTSHPSFAAFQGLHQYDGRLPDWSRAGIDREITRLHGWQQQLLALDVDATHRATETMLPAEFERQYLLAKVAHDLFWLEEAQWPQRNPDFYFNWLLGDLDFDMYVSRPYAPLSVRLQAWLRYAESLPLALQQIQANLHSSPLPPAVAEYGADRFNGMADFFEHSIASIFAGAITPPISAQFSQINAAAVLALRSLAASLQTTSSSAQTANNTLSFALGTPLFQRMLLATEGIDLSVAELKTLGQAELQRHQQALHAACARFAANASLAECMQRNADNKPAEGAVSAARQQLIELKQFLQQHDLVTIPGQDVALVADAPAYAVGWGAYIQSPGPYDKELPSVYYIAPPDPAWTPQEQHDYLIGRDDLLFTSVHEVWPGHFLHGLHSNRAASEPQRVFASYAFTEGWAHYSEEMIWEAGCGEGDASVQIGMLSNALLRDARLLTAIGLHTEAMTRLQAERLFTEQAYQNVALAREEALRAIYDPGVINYALGRILIRQLRSQWCQQTPAPCAWKSFHDQLLALGAPPLPLARQILLRKTSKP